MAKTDKKQAETSTVVNMPQQDKPKILLDLTKDPVEIMKQLKLQMTPEQRKQGAAVFKEPAFDMAKLLDIKAEAQAYCLKKMKAAFGNDAPTDGKEALGIIWKAHWPKRYYKLVQGANGYTRVSAVFSFNLKDYLDEYKKSPAEAMKNIKCWEAGGYGNNMPDWISGKGKKDGVDYEMVEMIDGKETKQGKAIQAEEPEQDQVEEEVQENDDE